LREVKAENLKVAYYLLNYHLLKREIKREREDIIHSSVSMQDKLPVKSNIAGDPTGRKGSKLADMRTNEWLELVKEVERSLPWKLQLILHLRRKVLGRRVRIRTGRDKGRPAWVPYVQRKYAEEAARRTGRREEDLWVSDRTLKAWWGRIVDYGARVACKKGLL
jgi:hypothetical protein